MEGRPKSIRTIKIHQAGREVSTRRGLDVVRHDQAIRCAVRPKPDERHPLNATGFHRESKKRFVKGIHREVHWPVWESQLLPVPKVEFLKMLANRNGQHLPEGIIGLVHEVTIDESTLIPPRPSHIALSAEIIGNLGGIKWETNLRILQTRTLQRIIRFQVLNLRRNT